MISWNDALPVSDRVDCLLRDPELFESWLEDWGSSAVVGYARSDEACPLARFLWDLTGEKLFVSYQGVYGGKLVDKRVADLPRWAKRFVAEIDNTAPDMPPSPVTADEARRYLEVALEGMPRRIYPCAEEVAAEVALEEVGR